jgi:hypothetical protein
MTPLPTAAYGVVLGMAALGYSHLKSAIIACNGRTSKLATALGKDLKGKLSLAAYAASVLLCVIDPRIGIAAMWPLPVFGSCPTGALK